MSSCAPTESPDAFRTVFRAFRRRAFPLHETHPHSVLSLHSTGEAEAPPPPPPASVDPTLSKTAQRRLAEARAAACDRNAEALDCLLPGQRLRAVALPAAPARQEAPWPALLSPPAQWQVYAVQGLPGVFCIANAIKAAERDALAASCRDNWGGSARPMPKKANAERAASRPGDADSAKAQQQQLQWSTLGYHYDWTHKTYGREDRSPFPAPLADACSAMASALGLGAFEAQAGIVNFYDAGATLCPHVDEAELDRRRPLFSLSLGLSAIFLVGGPTLNHRPAALCIESGDVLIMTGSARDAYHAVPRVLSQEESRLAFGTAAASRAAATGYLASHRININVRQVVSASHPWPEPSSEH